MRKTVMGFVGSVRIFGIGMIFLLMLAPRILAQDLRSSLIRAPYSLSFGEVTVGKASAPQTVTLLNPGMADIQVSKITITADFSQTNDCPVPPAKLRLNQSCNIKIIFMPSNVAPASGTASVFHEGSVTPLPILLSGAGTVTIPAVEIYPLTLDFSKQLIGPQRPPQTVTVSNSSGRALSISNIEVEGDFTLMPSSTCESLSGSLAAGASCSVVVTFTPLGAGKLDGQITFTDDAENSPQHIPLNGIGKR